MPTEDRKAYVRRGDKIFKVQRARHRRVLACRFCHGRKVKCCKTRPVCTNCAKAGLSCEYFDNMPKPVAPGPSPPHSLPSDGSPNTSPSSSSSLDDPIIEDRENKIRDSTGNSSAGRVEFTVETVGPYQTADQACWPFRHGNDKPPSSWLDELAKPFEAYRPNSTFTTILSNAQFQCIGDDLGDKEVNAPVTHKGLVTEDVPRSPASISSMTFSSSGSPRSTIDKPASTSVFDHFRDHMPSLHRCLTLLDRYSNSVHPIIPILNISELVEKCELLHESLRMGRDPDMSYLPLLFSVFYAASVSLYEDANVSDTDPQVLSQLKVDIHRFVGGAEMCLSMIHFPRKPSLLGCTVAIILYSVCRNDCRTEDSAGLAVLIRVAQLMGLHKDPSGDNVEDIQKRRIIWWYLVYLDAVSSLSSGLSPLIQPEEYTTKLPFYKSESSDQYLVFAIARFQWAELSSNIIRALHRPPVESLFEGLRAQISNFARAMDITILNFQSTFGGSSFCDWASSYMVTLDCRLTIMLDREIILRGLSRASNTSSVPDTDLALTEFYDKTTVKNASKFLNSYRLYANPARFANFIWEIRKFQPLQAILILLGAYAAEPDAETCQSLELTFTGLGYLGKKTTKKCVERWHSITELWNAAPKDRTTTVGDFDLAQFLDWVQESMSLQLWDPVSGHYVP
jgi:Fungal specific transcription factor domain/Fungal Zn(2)-Cys(6) binuclear cluster domain